MLPRIIQHLENHYGRFKDLIKPKPILTASSPLTKQHLEELFNHRVCCVHIKGFYPKAAAQELASRLTRDPSRQQEWLVASPGRGLESSDVKTIGLQPYNMVAAAKDKSIEAAYFEGAIACMRELREGQHDVSSTKPSELENGKTIGMPVLGPLDKLRLELDEIWPEGANVTKNKEGQAFVAGLARVMHGPTRHIEGFIHVDDINPLQQDEGLFSANLYLDLPVTGGGELLIYDVEVWSRWDFYRHASTLACLTAPGEEGQERLRATLPRPKVIKPEAGDLILLCTQRPHAVQGFPFGTRVSIQSFISYKKGRPLMLDN